jgi:hypothetical protein
MIEKPEGKREPGGIKYRVWDKVIMNLKRN